MGSSLYKLAYMKSDSKDQRPETGRRQGVMGADCKGRGRKTQCEDRNEVYVDRQWGIGVVRVRREARGKSSLPGAHTRHKRTSSLSSDSSCNENG